MNDYIVRWEIDIEAENPQNAARQALAIHRNPESIATVFIVEDKANKDTISVDVQEEVVVVSKKEYAASVKQYEASTKPAETHKRAVMESYDSDGMYFASAEYVKPGPGLTVVTTYRVRLSHLV